MSDDVFNGATRDPIALLEHLIGHVKSVKEDLAGVKEDLAGVKQDLAQFKQEATVRLDRLQHDVTAIRGDMAEVRREFARTVLNVDKDLSAHRESMELSIERKVIMERERIRSEWVERQADLERRIEELEEAERRRQGTGA